MRRRSSGGTMVTEVQPRPPSSGGAPSSEGLGRPSATRERTTPDDSGRTSASSGRGGASPTLTGLPPTSAATSAARSTPPWLALRRASGSLPPAPAPSAPAPPSSRPAVSATPVHAPTAAGTTEAAAAAAAVRFRMSGRMTSMPHLSGLAADDAPVPPGGPRGSLADAAMPTVAIHVSACAILHAYRCISVYVCVKG
jgi:hypothetical protein